MKKSRHYTVALALAQQKSRKWARVLGLLQKAAEAGDPRALYALGTWYLHGRHVERDVARGVELIGRAAQEGIPEALFDLAVSYERGIGLRRNKRLAVLNYLRAAVGGDVEAWFEVGRCFYYGIGVRRDRDVADVLLDYYRSLTRSKRRRLPTPHEQRRRSHSKP